MIHAESINEKQRDHRVEFTGEDFLASSYAPYNYEITGCSLDQQNMCYDSNKEMLKAKGRKLYAHLTLYTCPLETTSLPLDYATVTLQQLRAEFKLHWWKKEEAKEEEEESPTLRCPPGGRA